MNFDEFLKEKEKIEKLSIEEQKKFYEQLLKNKHDKTELYVYASFYYGHLFYQNGNFGKVIEIMEPIVMDYQSYPYTPKILSCFNLIGVAAHCEAEYSISRFFYKIALKIAKENSAKFYYAFEYNNIALTYIAEQNYTEAIRNLEFVERFPELSLFYRLFSPLDSEMICIFPYFCPYAESVREIREIFV